MPSQKVLPLSRHHLHLHQLAIHFSLRRFRQRVRIVWWWPGRVNSCTTWVSTGARSRGGHVGSSMLRRQLLGYKRLCERKRLRCAVSLFSCLCLSCLLSVSLAPNTACPFCVRAITLQTFMSLLSPSRLLLTQRGHCLYVQGAVQDAAGRRADVVAATVATAAGVDSGWPPSTSSDRLSPQPHQWPVGTLHTPH